MILCSHWLTEKILCSDWLHHLPHRLLDTEIILNFTKKYFYGKYLSFNVDLWENTNCTNGQTHLLTSIQYRPHIYYESQETKTTCINTIMSIKDLF